MIPEHRSNAPERDGEQAIDTTYPATAETLGAVRVAVRGWLRNLAVDETVVTDVVLAVSEACANAVLHAYRDRPTASFRLVGDRIGPDVRVIVSDNGCGPAPRSDSPGLGVGLPLMATLAKSLEVRRAFVGHGTVVTMAFDIVGRGSANGDRRDGHEDQRATDRDQLSGDRDQDLAVGHVDPRPRADGHAQGLSDQRALDIRARQQTSAARAEAAWLGALAPRARARVASTRDPLRLPTQRGDRVDGPLPAHR